MIDILRNNIESRDISYKRADWSNFRDCKDIVKNGQVIWKSSPYDAATTAYLRATYPAYWQAIRNFGWDNPQLVPWINEDNDLIVSLVGVGKERYVIGGRGNYANSGVKGNQDTRLIFEGKVIRDTSGELAAAFGADQSYNSRGFDCWVRYGSHDSMVYGTQNTSPSVVTPLSVKFSIDANKNHWTNTYGNGIVIWDKTFTYQTFETPHPILICSFNRNGSAYGNVREICCAKCHIQRDGQDHIFYPFKRNGQMGLLDIVTGTLATRVGTFTELIENTPT